MRSDYPSQIIGDVLLLNGMSKRSKINRTTQRMFSKMKANYSHVAFCLGVGECIHADTDTGVDVIFIDDLLNKYKGKWAAIRNKKLYKFASENHMAVRNKAIFYLDQYYDFKFKGLLSKKDSYDSTICSSLIAKIFLKLDIDLGMNPNETLPVHFERYLNHPEWNNVTEEHEKAVKAMLKCPDIKSSFIERRLGDSRMKNQIKQHIDDYNAINSHLKNFHNLMLTIGDDTKPFKNLPFKKIPNEYWDVKQPKDEDDQH